MEKAAGHVLKGKDIKLEGRFRLDAGQTTPISANERSVTSVVPHVCIVENHPEFAVMEVTCCCGVKTHIRCEYTDAQFADQDPNQKNNGENDDAS
jgi:hypothetical protein